MKAPVMVGIALIIFGIISFAYQGITYTTHKKVVDIGPIQASTTQHKTIPLSPVLGGILIIGGMVLVFFGSKKTA